VGSQKHPTGPASTTGLLEHICSNCSCFSTVSIGSNRSFMALTGSEIFCIGKRQFSISILSFLSFTRRFEPKAASLEKRV
jgi:hypothetical protein